MRHISFEAKEVILKKALNRGSQSIASIAQANGVSTSALHSWLRQYKEFGELPDHSVRSSKPEQFNRATQLAHIINTASLDEESLGVYCRKHGLYSHQLTQWKELFMTDNESKKTVADKDRLRSLKAENKQLKQELRRKEKALAEASALLIMKKKASLIWGELADD